MSKKQFGTYTEGETFAVAKAELLAFIAGTMEKISDAIGTITSPDGIEAAQASLYAAQANAQMAQGAADDLIASGGTFTPFRAGSGKRVTKKVRSRR